MYVDEIILVGDRPKAAYRVRAANDRSSTQSRPGEVRP